MYNIEKLYQSKHFQLIELRAVGKKRTAGILCFRGEPSKHDTTGKVVCAIEDGVVTASARCYNQGSRDYRRGRIVEIAGANGVCITYGRLACANVHEGDTVRAGEPIGIEGASGAGKDEYLTLDFRRNDRHIDGCELLGISRTLPQIWIPPKGETMRLVRVADLLKRAREVPGDHGSESMVSVRDIMNAPAYEMEESKCTNEK